MKQRFLNHSFTPDHVREAPSSSMRLMVPGLLAMLSAAPLALVIHYVHSLQPRDPERAVQWLGVIFSAVIALAAGFYLAKHRRASDPRALGLIVLTTVSVLLVAIYLYWVSLYVVFPADILIWSEGSFVDDMLKLRLGYPIYSAQADNESFSYTPGAQILTFLIAWVFGGTTSIPLWRVFQLGYVLVATLIAFLCCRELVALTYPAGMLRDATRWYALWLPSLFLLATNSITNPFVHNLHDDALALPISLGAYYVLLKYVSTRNSWFLALMALFPAAGFFVKQNLAIWAPLYCAYLFFFDRPRSVIRLLTFGLITFGAIGAVIGGCYLLWGEHFIYWVFNFRNNGVSPLRILQHVLDGWAYFVIGLIGGLILLRRKMSSQLFGAWLAWLILMLVEAWTSGLGWTVSHLGPGSLIAGMWFFASLPRLWPAAKLARSGKFQLRLWMHASIVVAVVGLLFSGLGVIRIPMKHFPDDAYRYVKEIEKEFEGQPADLVLLDAGSWIYLRQGVVMKDRAISFGDRGYNGTGDFSGMIKRLKEKRYAKILVRNFNSPNFLYDYWLWPRPSGVKKALLENYRLRGHIMPVEKRAHEDAPPTFFDEISILVPNPN